MNDASVVRYCGINHSGRCGYCKSTSRAKARMGEEVVAGDDDGDEGDSISFGRSLAHRSATKHLS